MRHPEIRDVCDLGQMLYYGWRWAWYATAVMFLLNNTFIQVSSATRAVLCCSLNQARVSTS